MSGAITQYLKYLNTQRKQYNGVIEKPARDVTINKLSSFAQSSEGEEIIAQDLVKNALNNNRRVLCWSDQHFNHDMLWKKGFRDFNSREEMNTLMLNNLNHIGSNDLVIFGGDLCFYNFKDILEAIKKVDCQKIYVLGNHDLRDNTLQSELKKIFDAVTVAFEFDHESILNGKNIIVTHYPIIQEDLKNEQFNLHGHTHKYFISERHLNMCVENTNYDLLEINELIMNHKAKYETTLTVKKM